MFYTLSSKDANQIRNRYILFKKTKIFIVIDHTFRFEKL